MFFTIFFTAICFVLLVNFSDISGEEQLERLLSHQLCSLDRDCKENSFCFGNDVNERGTCRCKDGFVISRNRSFYECLLPADTVGSACNRSLECQLTLGNPAICFKGTCTCNEHAHFVQSENQCFTTSGPGEVCNVDFNCQMGDYSIGRCYMGHCGCEIRHHLTENGICVKSAKLGQNCTINDECTHTHAHCYDVCRCIGGYAASDNGWECLLAATKFGEPCEQLGQCTELLLNSICDNGTCGCRPGWHGHGPRCWREIIPGGPCTDRRECIYKPELEELVDCIDGICTCVDSVAELGTCVPGGASSTFLHFTLVYLLISSFGFILVTL